MGKFQKNLDFFYKGKYNTRMPYYLFEVTM